MCQSLGTTVVLELKPPDIVLRLLQLFLGISNTHLSPPSSNYFCLEGAIPDPRHGIVDVIAQGMAKVKDGKLSGGIGADRGGV